MKKKSILLWVLLVALIASVFSLTFAASEVSWDGYTVEWTKVNGYDEPADYYASEKRLEVGVNTRPVTFEAWVYLPAANYASDCGYILGNTASETGFAFKVAANGVPQLVYGSTSVNTVTLSFPNAVIPADTWTHVAIVNGTDAQICYLNGVAVETLTGTYRKMGLQCFDEDFFLGADLVRGNTDAFKGSIGDVSVYSDVRTADEIAKDADRSASRDMGDDGLILHYNVFGTAKGDDIPDASGNGHNMNYGRTFATEQEMEELRKEDENEYAYSIAFIPDIQIVTNRYPAKLHYVYDWLLENAEEKNIQYVLSLGDMTHQNTASDWERMKEQTDRLDGVLPYTVLRGNHDITGNANSSDYPFFDEIYADKNSAYYNWVKENGGFYDEDSVWNTYHLFSAGDVDYIILCLDYYPDASELAWAGSVLEQYSDRRAIITTHYYMSNYYSKDNFHWDNLGRKYENIDMIVCGHLESDSILYSKSAGDNGNIVYELLINSQGIDKYLHGVGVIAMMYFTEDGNQAKIEYYSPMLDRYFRTDEIVSLDFTEKAEPKKESKPSHYDGTGADILEVNGDTFYVNSAADLAGIAALINEGYYFSGKVIRLTTDIVWNEGDASTWTNATEGLYPWSCGAWDYTFNGTFDGQGHVISGIYCPTNRGFIRVTSGEATIKNLSIVNSYFYGAEQVGAFVSCARSGSVTIENVYSDAYVYSGAQAGGLAGRPHDDATMIVKDSVFAGYVEGKGSTGGIVGATKDASGTVAVENCLNVGTVNSLTSNAGGIIGGSNSNTITIANCINLGTVSGSKVGEIGGTITATSQGNFAGNVYDSSKNIVDGVASLTGNTPLNVAEIRSLTDAQLTGYGLTDWTSGSVKGNTTPLPESVENLIAYAEEEKPSYYDGTPSTSLRTSEDGTVYYIDSAADLAYFATTVTGNAYSGKTVFLTTDIVYNEGDASAWTNTTEGLYVWACGAWDNTFNGVFDGQGHVISGIYCPTNRGFFRVTRGAAEVKNLSIVNSYFYGAEQVGAIVGCARSGSVTVENVYSDAYVYSGAQAGGLVGRPHDNATMIVKNSIFAGYVQGEGSTGGIAGATKNTTGTVTIENCLNVGTVKSLTSNAGGILGGSTSNKITITNCINLGTVSGTVIGEIGGTITATSQGNCTGNIYDSSKNIVDGIATLTGNTPLTVAEIRSLTNAQLTEYGLTAWTSGAVDGRATPMPVSAAQMLAGSQLWVRVNVDYIQYVMGYGEWINLAKISDFSESDDVSVQIADGKIQWKSGDAVWNTLIAVDDLPSLGGKMLQAGFTFDNAPESIYLGDKVLLSVQGGQSGGIVTYTVLSGPATVDADGNLVATDGGQIFVQAILAGNEEYAPAKATVNIQSKRAIPTTAEINVTVTLAGKNIQEGDFILLVNDTEISVGTDGKVLLPYDYAVPGVFTYTVKLSGATAGISYDETAYTVTVTVVNENGQLVATVDTAPTFKNTYRVPFAEGKIENGKYIVTETGKATEMGLVKIGNDYYYVGPNGVLITGKYYAWLLNENCDIETGWYCFGADGKMLQGICEHPDKDGLYYFETGKPTEKGLFLYDGDYYVAQYDGKIITGKYYVWKIDDSAKEAYVEGWYEFDENGVIVPLKNGIVDGYYYENGKPTEKGLFEYEGDLYVAQYDGKIITGKYYVWKVQEGLEDLNGAWRYFGKDGKLLQGIVDGYYYVNGVRTEMGLFKYTDNNYYVAQYDGKIITSENYTKHGAGKYYVWKIHESANDKKVGWYFFDAEGKMTE